MSRSSIANNSLRHIKNSKTVTNVDTDTSTQAVTLQAFLDTAIEEMCEEYAWPPLKTIVTLTLVEEDPNDEWGYSYGRPSDCAKPLYIVDGNLQPDVTSPRIPFEEGSDGSTQLIFTDEPDAQLAYTRTCDDVSIMSAKWQRALEYKLAYLIAPTMAGEDRTGLGQRAQANYEKTVKEAWAAYCNNRKNLPPPESEFITGR